MSNDTMPCGCEGHADNASLCRYPTMEEAAAQASRDAQQLTAALKEANEAAERFRLRAEQAEREVSYWKIATGASVPQHAHDALHNLRNDLSAADHEEESLKASLAQALRERDEARERILGLDAGNAELFGRVQRAEADNAAKDKAFSEYVEEWGVCHEDIPGTETPCPEDDTCECPRIVALNAAFRDGHPGAALLERMRALEKVRELLKDGVMGGHIVLVDECRDLSEACKAADALKVHRG